MNPNIFPEKIVRTTGTSGGFMSEVYDIKTWGNLGFIGIVFLLAIVAIFAPVFAGLLLLYQCLTKSDGDEGINIFSILFAIYILIDIKRKWFISIIMSPFYDSKEIIEVININGSLILLNLILLFFGGLIFKAFGQSRFIYFLFTGIVGFVLYALSSGIFNQIFKIY